MLYSVNQGTRSFLDRFLALIVDLKFLMSFHEVIAHFFLALTMPQFIHSPTERHLCCFHILAIMNKAAINIHVQVFVWT